MVNLSPRARSLQRVVARVRRRFHERVATAGTEQVDIRALVVPLRYDVVVRAQFFDFLAANPDLKGRALVDGAERTAYATWFDQVECARYFPGLLEDRERRDARFAKRVLGASRLLRSFEASGFDSDHPITLMTAPLGAVSDSGAPALGPVHVGDGCHRLALLLRGGATLEPWMYKVRPSLTPLVDNTAVLLRHRVVTEEDYVTFLGGRFRVGDAVTVLDAARQVDRLDRAQSSRLADVLQAQWGR